MNDDPDIIRWSQIKRFLIHVFGWMVTYAFFGWLGDVTRYSETSTTENIIILFVLSVFMAFITYKG